MQFHDDLAKVARVCFLPPSTYNTQTHTHTWGIVLSYNIMHNCVGNTIQRVVPCLLRLIHPVDQRGAAELIAGFFLRCHWAVKRWIKEGQVVPWGVHLCFFVSLFLCSFSWIIGHWWGDVCLQMCAALNKVTQKGEMPSFSNAGEALYAPASSKDAQKICWFPF